ncbi:hypothetical protein BR63_05205 [Thermanaerosceptrum fracticalcis]|uniref:Flagellar protein FliL n=1 Tax=Thermanaerosceptrum fracticalcis TaxID=1712410 RepID=A0A7G6E107_THEFR|nr:flagellar basal body-associated FliL family protein [Thermanaerosceptrum fracticalcis]QNB45761.1 hypothetical protein BR63_05205 [Thermanaerosceptrum fracticalcis]
MNTKEGLAKNIRLILLAVVILLLGVFVFWIVNLSQPTKGQETENKKVQLGPMFETESFTVNLSESTKRYIKAQFALELSNSKVKSELEEKLPLLQDAIITVLAKQSLEVLSTPEGKEKLKESVMEAVNSFLEKGKVQKVYFKSFLFS